jgi:hypothetical protein
MMHGTAAKPRRRGDPLLRITDMERDMAAGPIAAVMQLALQRQKLAFEVGKKGSRAGLLA